MAEGLKVLIHDSINILLCKWEDKYEEMEENDFTFDNLYINRQEPLSNLKNRIYDKFKIDRNKEIFCWHYASTKRFLVTVSSKWTGGYAFQLACDKFFLKKIDTITMPSAIDLWRLIIHFRRCIPRLDPVIIRICEWLQNQWEGWTEVSRLSRIVLQLKANKNG